MLLSIVVLSYNRPAQIERILEGFVGVESEDFNVVIKDDVSPRLPEIRAVVESYNSKLNIDVSLHVNEKNLGYDRNLLDAFNIVDSHYVFLLSDDDYIIGSSIPALLETLQDKKYDLYFTPYIANGSVCRSISGDYKFERFADVIYNSILFSGLIFGRKRTILLDRDERFLSNCIYSQVYLASLLVYQQNAYGRSPGNLLVLGGDGENFFGKNQAAVDSDVLADRSKVTSDLDYQKYLLRVVDAIASKTNPLVKKLFWREYAKRLIAYGLKVRALGIKPYVTFLRHYLRSDSQRRLALALTFLMIALIPGFMSRKIYMFGVVQLRKAG